MTFASSARNITTVLDVLIFHLLLHGSARPTFYLTASDRVCSVDHPHPRRATHPAQQARFGERPRSLVLLGYISAMTRENSKGRWVEMCSEVLDEGLLLHAVVGGTTSAMYIEEEVLGVT